MLTDRSSYEAGYRFRATIESGAVLDPHFKIDREAFRLAREQQQLLLDEDVRKISRARLFRINSELHEMIVACSGNEFYVEALRRVNRLRRLIEYRLTVDRSRINRQCKEHLKLLDLLEGGDLQEASAFLRRHIEGANSLKSPGVEQPPASTRRKDRVS
jgi:DNA-binding GntR family transcriptional regulator